MFTFGKVMGDSHISGEPGRSSGDLPLPPRLQGTLEPQGFSIEWTPDAIDWIAGVGYDPEFGARPVKRAIQEHVLNELSKKLLAEVVLREKPIIIDADTADGSAVSVVRGSFGENLQPRN